MVMLRHSLDKNVARVQLNTTFRCFVCTIRTIIVLLAISNVHAGWSQLLPVAVMA